MRSRFSTYGMGCLAVLVWLFLAVPAQATNDLLLLPAVKSDKAASSLLMDLAIAGERLVAVGERGHILYSDNNGASWIQAEVPVSVTLTAVGFPTAQKGWAVGHDGIVLHSSNAGQSWVKQLDGSQINELMLVQIKQLQVEKKAQVAAAGDDERESLELELEDLHYFANDVKMAVDEGPTRPFMDLWFKNDQEGIVVGAFGMILSTKNGGESWEPILDRIDNPDGFHYYGIARSGGSLFIAGEAGMLFRSEDDGQSWQRLDSPYEGSFFGVVGNPDGGVIVAFGLRGNAFCSQDDGRSWQSVGSSSGAALSGGTILADGSVLLIGNDGGLIRSLDGGIRFSRLSARFPGSISLTEAADGNVMVVGFKGVSRIAASDLNN